MPRHPLGARRAFAERYLLITIVAFATTVAATRWYLDLAGYPTIGGGDLHVAHVLWGGLALIVAVLLPMLFVGRRAMLISAVLAGIGVGLFIDEVGKFLTTSNDYFYAPAAPIIYGSILVLVLLWVAVRRSRRATAYDATQAMVQAVQDSIDGNLSRTRRDQVVDDARRSADAAPTAEASVATRLAAILESPSVDERLSGQGWVASGTARRSLERILPTRIERVLIVIGLAWSTLQAVVAVLVLLFWDQVLVGGLEIAGGTGSPIEYPDEPFWSLLMLAIAVLVGVASAVAISLMRRHREKRAIAVALLGVLAGMVGGDLVAFYAFQIGALASTLIDVVFLLLIVDYRIRLDHGAPSARSDGEPAPGGATPAARVD